MKKLIRKIFNWILKEELNVLNKMKSDLELKEIRVRELQNRLESILQNSGISVDFSVHDRYEPSYAVICIQGGRNKPGYMKFIPLHGMDIRQIEGMLKPFERNNITLDVPYGIRNFSKFL